MTDADSAASGTASPADGGARPSATASTKGNGARSRATASKPAQSPRKRGAATTAPKKIHATSSASTTIVDAEDSLTPKVEAELAKDAEATRKDLNSLDQNTFEIVHRVGGRLTKHKKRLGHGRWLRFLSECRLGEQSARNYMNVFKSFPNPHRAGGGPTQKATRNSATLSCISPTPSSAIWAKDYLGGLGGSGADGRGRRARRG